MDHSDLIESLRSDKISPKKKQLCFQIASISTTVVDEASRCRKTNSWITWGRNFVWNERSCSFESSYYHYCSAEQTQNRDFSTPKEKKKKNRCRWVQKRVYKLFSTIMNRSENQETGKGKNLYRNWPVMALITCRSRFPIGSWTNNIINQKKKFLTDRGTCGTNLDMDFYHIDSCWKRFFGSHPDLILLLLCLEKMWWQKLGDAKPNKGITFKQLLKFTVTYNHLLVCRVLQK